jgi:hypothetical protein
MADPQDLNPEVPEVVETPEAAPQEKQPSAVEQRAMEQGWVPQDEWTGDPDDWRPAKEFVDRGELLKSISSLKRDNVQLKQAMEEFGKHHAKVREIEYQRAINDLKAQRREALADGELVRADELEERIDTLKEAKKQDSAPVVHAPTEIHPAYAAWEQKNRWYQNERAMKIFADEVAKDMVQSGERDVPKILDEVDRQVRKEFPNKFTNPNREKAGAVEGSTNKGSKAGGRSGDEGLTDDERRIMNKLVSTGVITKAKWLEEYKAIKGQGA